MKIAVYMENVDPKDGGGSSFENTLINALIKTETKHEFFIFCFGKGQITPQNNIKFLSIPEEFKKRGYSEEKSLDDLASELAFENKIDMVWFTTIIYRIVNLPFIYTVWDLQHRLQPFFPEISLSGWRWADRERTYTNAFGRCAYTITGTNAGKKEIMDFYNVREERIKVIPFPVSDFAFKNIDTPKNPDIKEKYKIKSDYLYYPAQFWPHKNHIMLLYMLKILKDKYNIVSSLVFSGSDKGNMEYVKEKAKELELENNIHFLGFVPEEDLIQLYKNALVMVFPTFFGPDNLPPLEAFALGCPVIASNVDGSQEQYDDAAILLDPKKEEDWALTVKNLYENPELREELTEKGYKNIQNKAPEGYIKSIMEIFDEFEPIRRCWSNSKPYIHT